MPTSSLELLALSKRLQVENGTEAVLRCSISRAYYAALLTAAQTFPARNPESVRVNESSHEQIIARAQIHGAGANPGRSCAINVAKLLPKIKRTRVLADYRLDETITQLLCIETVERAEYIIEQCTEVSLKIEQANANNPASSDPSSSQQKPTLTRIQ